MDLENDFYLVHFQDKDNFDRILMDGPWVIFGHYLTIRPWPSNFSAANTEVDNQILWIRLPSLSEGYYSKMLIRAIGQTIRPECGIDSAVINPRVDSISKEGNKEVMVDLPRYVEGMNSKVVDDGGGDRKIASREKEKGVAVANGHRKNLQILRPNNSGPGLHLSKGFSGLNNRASLVESGFDRPFGNLNTQAVNSKTNLDRNKHKAYCLVIAYESGSRKENEMFRFGVTRNESMERAVEVTVEANMHRKKPPDIGRTNHDQPMVGISEVMEGHSSH
ncbi:hypothetical protein GOBAR_AA27625 [Gossypium barbadense]|uniref:DUF4283 domain-containing protein n=1 Tax=Gossypium barbadense TaxID=3634 RepID=A0A2P5WPP3_GOSBA|nr:hypothetical protein GOBAR_AA27625 [Gossypium barbadense]